jgi:superfamily II RNA helicase
MSEALSRWNSYVGSNFTYGNQGRQIQDASEGNCPVIPVAVALSPLTHCSTCQKIQALEERLSANPLQKSPKLPELYNIFAEKEDCRVRIRNIKKKIQATNDVLQLEELRCRKRVLRRLGFTTSADIVDMKGRVACEISTGDELLLTELIFNGTFNPLEPEQCAALLSCFVFGERVRPLLNRALTLTIDPFDHLE